MSSSSAPGGTAQESPSVAGGQASENTPLLGTNDVEPGVHPSQLPGEEPSALPEDERRRRSRQRVRKILPVVLTFSAISALMSLVLLVYTWSARGRVRPRWGVDEALYYVFPVVCQSSRSSASPVCVASSCLAL